MSEEKLKELAESIFNKLNDEEKLYLLIVNNEKNKIIERLNNIINKLCWKPIEEYDKGDYDWVLIKYFDKDYECIPIVAEKRLGKWYSESEMEIQFDVKYFFDMQQLDKLKELKGSDNNDK